MSYSIAEPWNSNRNIPEGLIGKTWRHSGTSGATCQLAVSDMDAEITVDFWRRRASARGGGDMRCAWYQQGRDAGVYINGAVGPIAPSLRVVAATGTSQGTPDHNKFLSIPLSK
jgi:hypothetical protein